MAYEHKENKGSIFKNEKKEKETHPDYTGQVNVAGKLYNISAWINERKRNTPRLYWTSKCRWHNI